MLNEELVILYLTDKLIVYKKFGVLYMGVVSEDASKQIHVKAKRVLFNT